MRRRAIMFLLAGGALLGFGSGFASLHAHCRAHREWMRWQRYEAPCGPMRWAPTPPPTAPAKDVNPARG